ncbi:MAG TPA: hypothetical protein VGK49_07555 [Ilumatobacteraceae bacterium]
MQRSLAGVLFLLAAIALSIAAGGWWLERTALTPSDTSGQTEAILDDDQIRAEVTTVIAAATAPTLEQAPNEVAAFIDPIIDSRPGAAVMSEIVRDAHRRVIGEREIAVRVTGPQMVEVVRDQRVVDLPPVTLPVPRVGTLDLLRHILTWMVPILAAVGVILVILAFITRPEKGELIRALGEFGVALAVSMLVFGYALPVHIITAIDDNTWTRAVPQLATRALPVALGATAIFAVGGVVLILSSLGTGRRKQWSTPLAVGRYRDERSWS